MLGFALAVAVPVCGTVLKIDGHSYTLQKKLGEGAFGCVWQAATSNNMEVAIKLMEPADLLEETREISAMQELKTNLPKEAANLAPQYLGHAILKEKRNACAQIVMTKIHGKPLDEWLYGKPVHEQARMTATSLVAKQIMDFNEASSLTAGIVKQLAVVLDAMSWFHRDVSAHNVMMTQGGAALIDFGAAAQKSEWAKNWHSRNVSGDPRYWTPQAWMIFAYGPDAVKAHSSAEDIYKQRIDHHAVGILACEVLFATWKQPTALRCAWMKHWSEVFSLWKEFQAAQRTKCYDPVRRAMRQKGSVKHLQYCLGELI